MEPTDSNPEHCGAEECLAECGCSCSECRATVKYMYECGNEGPTLDVHKELAAAKLQVSAMREVVKWAREVVPMIEDHYHTEQAELENALAKLDGIEKKEGV